MRDDWARIIELERRQRKNSYELNAIERTVKAAKEKLKLADQALPTVLNPCSGGGGGTSNVIRWAKDFCMAVVFDTYPEINPGYSENLTKDTESLADAIHALETGVFIPPEYYLSETDQYVLSGGDRVYYQTDSQMWQFMSVGASYATRHIDEIASPHLKNVRCSFSCGWIPSGGAEMATSQYDPDDIVNVVSRYVPSVSPRRIFYSAGSYTSVTDLPNWDVLFPTLYSPEFFGVDIFGRYYDPVSPMQGFVNLFQVTTKAVEFWTYDAAGMKKHLRTLAYHHSPYELTYVGEVLEAITLRTPYKHTTGPKKGTTGSYLLPAFGSAYGIFVSSGGSGVSGEFFAFDSEIGSRFGVAELFVSWGSTCEDAVPPIDDDTPEDWEDFCAAITAASATFLKIPGLTIKFNGTALTTSVLGSYFSQPTIEFEFAERLQEYLDANPDVFLTYDFTAICTYVPHAPIYGSGIITNGLTIVFDRNTTCDGRSEITEYTLVVKMEATPARDLFHDICCVPYGTHCGTEVLQSDQIEWYLDPP